MLEQQNYTLNSDRKYRSLFSIGKIFNILSLILVIYYIIALSSKVLTIFLTCTVGIIAFLLIVLITVISLGTIFLGDFGNSLISILTEIWTGDIISNITAYMFLSSFYTSIIGIVFCIFSIISFSIIKSKKRLTLSIIYLILFIVFITIKFIGVI